MTSRRTSGRARVAPVRAGEAATVFVNGRFVPASRAVVSVFDRGFLYGDGLFETVRVHRGRPFLFERHLERARRSAAFFGIAIPFRAY